MSLNTRQRARVVLGGVLLGVVALVALVSLTYTDPKLLFWYGVGAIAFAGAIYLWPKG